MPYIDPRHRTELDTLIDQLAGRIVTESGQEGGDTAFAGLLNYTCTRLALKVVRLQFGEMKYGLIAIVTGTFKNISDEFYRRVGAPYEDKKMAANGDVDLYKEYTGELDKN